MLIVDVEEGETEQQAEARAKASARKPDRGVFPTLSREAYDALERDNWSRIKAMGKSPAHYQHLLGHEREDTDALKRGRVTHLAILEPERFRNEVAVWLGGRRQGERWQEFLAANAGREVVTGEEWEKADDMRAAVRRHPDAARYLASGRSEVSVLWTDAMPPIGSDPGYRFDCKGRLDFLSDAGVIVDLKTTRDASPEGFGREAWRLRYDAQAAFYVDGYEAASGKRLPCVLVAVETEPPHVVQVYRVQEEILELGREHYRALLDRLALCRREARWGGYVEGEMALILPRWAAPRLDDEDVSGLDLSIGE